MLEKDPEEDSLPAVEDFWEACGRDPELLSGTVMQPVESAPEKVQFEALILLLTVLVSEPALGAETLSKPATPPRTRGQVQPII